MRKQKSSECNERTKLHLLSLVKESNIDYDIDILDVKEEETQETLERFKLLDFDIGL